jgi:hypothetical protein
MQRFPRSGHADVGHVLQLLGVRVISSPIVTSNPNSRRSAPSMLTMLMAILGLANTFS